MTEPAAKAGVRAAYMKNLFQSLDARGRLPLLSEGDGSLLNQVDGSLRIGWLPLSANVRVVEILCDRLGEDEGLGLLSECVYEQFETPLWRGFIGPAVRMLGKDPASLGRWIPAALQIVFRGCGSWAAEDAGACELTVGARDLPQEIAGHRLWLRSIGIGMGPLFTVCAVDGTTDLQAFDAAARTATYHLRWKAGAGI